jgi:metallo-beta-lactamase class B
MKPRFALLIVLLFGWRPQLAMAQNDPSWTAPMEPFRIVGNIYFVGTRGLSSFLLTTPSGHVLIDTGLDETVPMIAANVEKLGFKTADIKVMLSSHAHYDHVGGHARMQKLTGATVMAVGEDAASLASGKDTSALQAQGWTPVKVGRVLRDGDTVTQGDLTLTAHLTPGHTKGCTAWTTTVTADGRRYTVLFVGGTSVNGGVKLVGNTIHPQIAEDYARTFRVLKELKPDIFLAQHPSMFDMEGKAARLKPGAPNPFVDPQGYATFVAENEKAYLTRLAEDRKAIK